MTKELIKQSKLDKLSKLNTLNELNTLSRLTTPTFAVIGTGFIFPTHLKAINQIGGKIIDAVNLSHGENAWREMVKNTEADCIVILTPNDLHFEMAKFSAENKKIVLCEKPLTIKSEDARALMNYPNIFTVCQLRYHPFTKELKSKIKESENYKIEMDISVHRDKSYFESWKAQKERSGGILFNLGIHYFDLLLYLFGKPEKVSLESLEEPKIASGFLEGKNYKCNFKISTIEPKETQRRVFKINGKDYNFSSKENLAFENLHYFVYKDLLKKEGITPKEALKSIELIEKILI
jgi:UDP-N-acetyl-2-amino-2-deoxyglucuronate dehydrogenase